MTALAQPLSTADSSAAWTLDAVGVTHQYGGDTPALDDVSLHVPAGRALALVGESGSGKSSLLRCFNRLLEPARGEILVGGTAVRHRDPIVLRRHIGYVPQDGGLLPHWRVLRNAALVPTLLGAPLPNEDAARALDLVGLSASEFGSRFPHELSGGQRQRVALARAIAARPRLLLLDEPFGALDAITREELQETLVEIRAALGVTMLFVTHDFGEAARLADEIAVMRRGRIEQCAAMTELASAPATDYVARLLQRARAAAEALGT